jgi:hypothetical protein
VGAPEPDWRSIKRARRRPFQDSRRASRRTGITPTGTQFITLDNAGFTPTSGQAGLRVFNAASTIGSIVALNNGTALGTGTGVSYGNAGAFMNVPTGSQTITFNTGTGTTTIANTGSLSFTAGQNYTLVVAPAATGSNTLRTFMVAGC